MARNRNSSADPTYEEPNEGDYQPDPTDEITDIATIALDAEAEAEHLRQQMQQQQQQIEKLFQLVRKQRSRPDGGNGPDAPADTPAVQQFKKRMQVLKKAYPNTRI